MNDGPRARTAVVADGTGSPRGQFLPVVLSGAVERIRSEVQRLKRELGAGGGYISEPAIIIQANVPLDNMVALSCEAIGSVHRQEAGWQ